MFKKNPQFETIQIADEYMAVPIGERATILNGIVALNETTFYLLGCMDSPKSKDELVELVIKEFDAEKSVVRKDLDSILNSLIEIGIVEECK